MRGFLVLVALTLGTLTLVSAAAAFERTSEYGEKKIGGWTVLVSSAYSDHPRELDRLMAELTRQLSLVDSSVPAKARARLMKTRIWVEYAPRVNAGGEFHVSRNWLRSNGLNPEKALGIEINYNFYKWRKDQPSMLLHELAHAYHHTVLGLDNWQIKKAFEDARLSGAYTRVRRNGGVIERAYALTNHEEYFAELTEAFFGRNDYQPFDQSELKEFDPTGYAMIQAVWSK